MMMKTQKWLPCVLGVVSVVGCLWTAPGAQAQGTDLAAAGRAISSRTAPAIVTVEFVTKLTMSMSGGESDQQERKSEVTGTVIDPSGLTVVSLASMDPSAMLDALMGAGMNVRSDVTEVKIRMADGREIPGKLVLRDKDQDLAFIRPQKKLDAPVYALDLKQGAEVDVLDSVLILSRLGKVVNRSLSTRLDRVVGIMEKPRKRYLLNNEAAGSGELGGPVLGLDGKLVGLVALKATRGTAGENDLSENVAPIIIPAQDILTVATQAPEDAPKETPPPAAKPAAASSPKPAAPAAPKK